MRILLISLLLVLLVAALAFGAGAGDVRPEHRDIAMVRELAGRGELIELSSRGELAVLTGGGLIVVDPLAGDTLIVTAPPVIYGNEYTDRALAFSRDGGLLAASANSSVIVLDLDRGRQAFRRTYPIDHVMRSMGALAFTPDNSMLLIGGQMSHVILLDLPTGDIVDSLGIGRIVVGISILPDSSMAAVATFGGEVILWNWTDGEAVDTLRDCGSWGACLGSTESFLAASCGPDTVRVWDSGTLQLRGLIGGHRFIGHRFSLGRSGYMLAGSGPGTSDPPEGVDASEVLLFDLTTLKPVASWRAHSPVGIYDTAMTPDGALFATCGYDGTVNIWKCEDP
jgi:WD40 repeat protein